MLGMAYSCGNWLKYVGDSLDMWEMALVWEKRVKYLCEKLLRYWGNVLSMWK